MRRVDFDHVEAGLIRTTCGGSEISDHFTDSSVIQGIGDGVMIVESDGAGGDGLPASFGRRNRPGAFPRTWSAGFAPCMGNLDSGGDFLFSNELRNAR